MNARNGDGVIRVVVAAISAVRRTGLEAIVKNNSSFKLVGSLPTIVGFAARIRELEANVAEQQKEIKALVTTVKEQAAQIQKVSAQLEASKLAPQVVNNN